MSTTVKMRSSVTFVVLLELDEEAARALCLLSEFDPDQFLVEIQEKLSPEVGRRMQRTSWKNLMRACREQLGQGIREVDAARAQLPAAMGGRK